MSERSVVLALLGRIELEAQRRNATRVRRVTVRIGEVSGVDPDLLAAAFAAGAEGTVCHGAELRVRRVATTWSCPSCGIDLPRGAALRCARCGAPGILREGSEMDLEQIDFEVAS
jgi:hydrogenase nickel incorporation protein HypA/HybF